MHHPAIVLRDATMADLPALLALEAPFRSDRLSARQFRHHLRGGDGRLRVAVDGDCVVGYALLLMRSGSGIARLYSLAVDPSVRGRGIGAALLADLECRAAARGCRALRLEVAADNPRAIALYHAAGYRRLAELPRYYEDGSDAWRYQKDLDR